MMLINDGGRAVKPSRRSMHSLPNVDQNGYENGENIKEQDPSVLSAIPSREKPVITTDS
jgi:hypothetical protein